MKFDLQRTQAQLIAYFPYFAAISGPLLNFAEGDSIPTANGESAPVKTFATNGDDVVFNPEYMTGLTVREQNFRCCEMVLAVARRQHLLRGGRNKAKWKVACAQCRLNELNLWMKSCNENKVPLKMDIPAGVKIEEQFANMDEFQIYDLLPDSPSGGGAASGEYGDVVDPKGFPQTAGDRERYIRSKSNDILQATRQAQVRAARAGSASGFWADLAEAANDVGPDPESMLNRFLGCSFPTDRAWANLDRRAWAMGQVMPGEIRNNIGILSVYVDCSGSMYRETIAEILHWISFACQSCKPEKIHVIYFTGQVERHDVFDFYEPFVVPDQVPDGGTSFYAVRQYVEDLGLSPQAEIWITDGFDNYPPPPNYPSLWLMTTDQEGPDYGETWQFYSKLAPTD